MASVFHFVSSSSSPSSQSPVLQSPPLLSLFIAVVPRNVSDPSVIAKGTLGIREFPSGPVCVCVCVVNRYRLMDSSLGCCPSAWPMKCSQLRRRPRWQPIKWKLESLKDDNGLQHL